MQVQSSLALTLNLGNVTFQNQPAIDNLPGHKLASIEPLIQSLDASVLNLSPYSSDFNPIELWWSQFPAFLRHFSPNTMRDG